MGDGGNSGQAEHFKPNEQVDPEKLGKALTDVFGEKGIRGKRVEFEIDEDYWRDIADDPWSGNLYRYHF
jgi:hypothetical protein